MSSTTTTPITANVVRDLALPREIGSISRGRAELEVREVRGVGDVDVTGTVRRDDEDGELIVSTDVTLWVHDDDSVRPHVTILTGGDRVAVSLSSTGFGTGEDAGTFYSRMIGAHMDRADAIALRDELIAAEL